MPLVTPGGGRLNNPSYQINNYWGTSNEAIYRIFAFAMDINDGFMFYKFTIMTSQWNIYCDIV